MKHIVAYLISVTVLAGLLGGCDDSDSFSFMRNDKDYIKPTIAVMKFENRAPATYNWNLGDGTADMLVNSLMQTKRFQVIERPEINSILREIQFQQSGATRENERTSKGRLKNVQYLVKGTITEFGHVSKARGDVGLFNWDFGAGKSAAVMGVIIYVVDVESGEIICSQRIVESLTTNDAEVAAVYKDVSFGSRSFCQTPLGKVTTKVIDKAVRSVVSSVASKVWEPKIALAQGQTVVINGGKNRKLSAGAEYEVLDHGTPIIDPDTGDAIGQQTGRVLARVRITEVNDQYSTATVFAGDPKALGAGMKCRRWVNPKE